MRPLIAVTTTSIPESGVNRSLDVHLDSSYMSAFERLGMTCVLVSPAHPRESVRDLVGLARGLVLPGGEDVDPAFYGERPIPELGQVNPGRDVMEFAALEVALERRIPILAICRGCQVLNVHLGGTLYQDLNAQRPGALRHRQTEPWYASSHEVTLESDSRLCRLLREPKLSINSFHHQAIKDLGSDLRVVARAEDGLIEAVEHDDPDRWVIGVQWHPERHEAHTPDEDPDRRLLAEFHQEVLRCCGDAGD